MLIGQMVDHRPHASQRLILFIVDDMNRHRGYGRSQTISIPSAGRRFGHSLKYKEKHDV